MPFHRIAADQDRMAALEFGRNAGARLQGSEVLAVNHPNVDAGPPKRIGMSVATFASGLLVNDSLDSICGSGHFRRDQRPEESRGGKGDVSACRSRGAL